MRTLLFASMFALALTGVAHANDGYYPGEQRFDGHRHYYRPPDVLWGGGLLQNLWGQMEEQHHYFHEEHHIYCPEGGSLYFDQGLQEYRCWHQSNEGE